MCKSSKSTESAEITKHTKSTKNTVVAQVCYQSTAAGQSIRLEQSVVVVVIWSTKICSILVCMYSHLQSAFSLDSIDLCLSTILVKQAPISLVAPAKNKEK